MLKTIELTVRGQELECKSIKVASGLVEQIQCHFSFADDKWNYPAITAMFENKTHRVTASDVVVNGTVKVPWEVLVDKGEVKVNLEAHTFDGKEIITQMTSFSTTCIQVAQQVLTTAGFKPTPEPWERALEEIKKQLANKMDIAPDDGKQYGGQGKNWTEITGGAAPKPYAEFQKIGKWFDNVTYVKTEEEYVRQYMYERYHGEINKKEMQLIAKRPRGGCSAVFVNDMLAKNLDWTFSECLNFRVVDHSGKYSFHGMAGGVTSLTQKTEYSEVNGYRVLPFMVNDGENSEGLKVGLNVVPLDETKGGKPFTKPTTGTKPELQPTCLMMIPALLLKNYATAKEACKALQEDFNIYAPHTELLQEEMHLIIADEPKEEGATADCFIVEFIDNKVIVLDAKEHPWMVNYYYFGAEFNDKGEVNWATLTDHPQGVHRSNLIAAALQDKNMTMLKLLKLMQVTLRYTTTYKDFDWRDEFCGYYEKYGDLTIEQAINNPERFRTLFTNAGTMFQHRSRDPLSDYFGTWQTVHSVVYCKGVMYVIVEEQGMNYISSFKLDTNYTSASDTTVFEQKEESDRWIIKHNHNNYPSVTLYDGNNIPTLGEVNYIDGNTIEIKFTKAIKGIAYLN